MFNKKHYWIEKYVVQESIGNTQEKKKQEKKNPTSA